MYTSENMNTMSANFKVLLGKVNSIIDSGEASYSDKGDAVLQALLPVGNFDTIWDSIEEVMVNGDLREASSEAPANFDEVVAGFMNSDDHDSMIKAINDAISGVDTLSQQATSPPPAILQR